MRRSAGCVENKAQSNAVTQPYGAKARMVTSGLPQFWFLPAFFGGFFYRKRRCGMNEQPEKIFEDLTRFFENRKFASVNEKIMQSMCSKVTFRRPKGYLLQRNRPPFGV